MYAFLNRAQNYSPIQSLSAKTPMEKVTALVSSGNLPIGKMITQPLIANNMDKIISAVSKDLIAPMIRNGNLNLNLNDMISAMSNQLQNNNDNKSPGSEDDKGENSDMDIGSLFETFMPLMNNIMSNSSSNSDNISQDENNSIHSNDSTKTENIQDTKEKNSPIEPIASQEILNESKKSSENINDNTTPLEIKPRNRKRRYS
ncbi:hypothetical protein J2Z76_001952 [Sedimentibacter acidaminivorans]|jgi:hypothetical protein|uniref:YqfQ-like protein n=1 Tax=Sedimentibacter acidaminivorans TaxID=913099 RepID=A0ABS4GEG7_9FIRM|nr:hypothetical protein [Sedimentibacter acidaminivorans]MBP1926088.1 hypothetical protein [Sedimentibacter acidaminivorans]